MIDILEAMSMRQRHNSVFVSNDEDLRAEAARLGVRLGDKSPACLKGLMDELITNNP